MEMVWKYLSLELNKEKRNLELVINDLYNEMECNNRKHDYNVSDKITKIFPLNRYDEGMEINSLIRDINNYLDSEDYDENKQKRLIVRISNAIKIINSI